MPTAPQVPGLTPTAVPTARLPNVDLPVPVDAFGGAVGRALEGLGTSVEQGSDRIWNRAMDLQNLQNETEAKNADAKYMMESGKMHADFINKEGLNAGPEALAAHIQALQDKRDEIRGTLSNPRAQQMYDASSLSFMGRNIFNAAGHSGQQIKVAANNASDARIDQAKTNINTNPDDNVTWQRGVRQIQSEVDAKADNGGWTDDQRKETKEYEVSQAAAHRIAGMAKTNAIGAQKLYDGAVKAGLLRPADAEKVQATVQGQFRDQGSRYIADKVLAGRREGEDEDDTPVQDYIDKGLEEAKKYGTDDPLFGDFVRDRIVSQYNRQRAIERDSDNTNTTIIGKALLKANAEGVHPSTIEELKATDPSVSAAWEQLGRNPRLQSQVLKQLNANAEGQHVPLTPENMQAFHQAKGEAMFGGDDQRAAFMAKNWAAESKLTLGQRNSLLNLQESLRKQSEADPRVIRAVRLLQPDMQAAGIDRTADHKEDYYAFVGSLQDQLDAYGKEHPGKTPSFEEVKTMGAQLMQEVATGNARFGFGSFGVGTETVPTYKFPVPEEDAKRLRDDSYWKSKGIVPNDAMIARIYRAEVFNEKFKGAAKKAPDAAFPPNNPLEARGE